MMKMKTVQQIAVVHTVHPTTFYPTSFSLTANWVNLREVRLFYTPRAWEPFYPSYLEALAS
jgi:hypothetical protein